MRLQHSKVKRGGITSPYWYGETTSVSATVDEEGLDFRFSLPSKGGGTTSILLAVGIGDLPAILKKMAQECPDLAEAFAEATHVAVARLRKRK